MLTFYENYKFISEEEARRCIRQWPHFRSRVSKLKREEVYDVHVDIVNENEDDIDSMLILLSSMMIISCSTCEWRKRIFVQPVLSTIGFRLENADL